MRNCATFCSENISNFNIEFNKNDSKCLGIFATKHASTRKGMEGKRHLNPRIATAQFLLMCGCTLFQVRSQKFIFSLFLLHFLLLVTVSLAFRF